MSGKHALDRRFDYLFEPLAVDPADGPAVLRPQRLVVTEVADQPQRVPGRRVVLAAVLAAIGISGSVLLLLQPAEASDSEGSQSDPTPLPTMPANLPTAVISHVSSSSVVATPVETPSAPPAPSAPTTYRQPAATAPQLPTAAAPPSTLRPPPSSPTRAPMSVAPAPLAPLPYPDPSQDSRRPGGILGGHGLL